MADQPIFKSGVEETISAFSPDVLLERLGNYASPARFFATLNVTNPLMFNGEPPKSLDSCRDSLERGVLCHTTTLPGRTLSTETDHRHGPTRKIGTNTIYDDIDLQFYLAGRTHYQAQDIYNFFVAWHEFISGATQEAAATRSNFYGLNFYDSYVTDLTIEVFGPMSVDRADPILRIRCYEAYPISISPIQLTWLNQDEVMSFGVTFTYHSWTSL